MTALAAAATVFADSIPSPRSSHTYQRVLTAGTRVYGRGITAYDPATGMWVKPDGTVSTVICTGLADLGEVDSLTGGNDAAGVPLEMRVVSGCFRLNSTGLDKINEQQVVYLVDDNTFSLTPGLGPVLGILEQVVSSTVGYVMIDPIVNAILSGSASLSARKCRMVSGSSVPVYTGSKTATLTVTATGALAAMDGVTPAVNDVVFFQEGSTNLTDPADAGPWKISVVGTTGVSPVFVRPSWWSHGSPIVPDLFIEIGAEGTGTDPGYAGTRWKTWCIPGKVIGADAPVFWPVTITSAVTLASGTLAAARTTMPVRSHLVTDFIITSDPATPPHANTRVWRVSALTAGVTGAASVQMVAESAPATTNASDVGQYNLTIHNGG